MKYNTPGYILVEKFMNSGYQLKPIMGAKSSQNSSWILINNQYTNTILHYGKYEYVDINTGLIVCGANTIKRLDEIVKEENLINKYSKLIETKEYKKYTNVYNQKRKTIYSYNEIVPGKEILLKDIKS